MDAPIMKAKEVAYPRLRVPDLDRMEVFLNDFGLTTVEKTSDALFLRAADPDYVVHVVEKGEPAFLGFALYAHSEDDLQALSESPDASDIETIDEPGGGKRVNLTDPDGFRIEVIHRTQQHEPLVQNSDPINFGGRQERLGETVRCPQQPARIKRLGHVGINVADLARSYEWYHRHLGILPSDGVGVGDKEFAYFCRFDRGEAFTDHHSVLLAQTFDEPGFNHCSFEVIDINDVYVGKEYLESKGYKHTWGIGRHTLGSQIFDYWRDPWGMIHEHFVDGDIINREHEFQIHPPEAGAGSQWGPQMPADFGRTVTD
jgi:catechol 2,3-dioxygenase-like lactoylglutathione lyase family enzyme